MDILYYFNNYDSPMYQWQRYHIVNEMEGHDCHIKTFSPLDFSSKDEANQALLQELRTHPYQLFMTCLTEADLYLNTLKDIKATGIPTLLFCPDNLAAPYNHKSIAPHFDLVWLTSIETEYLFKRWGCNTVFLPYAANPKLFEAFQEDELEERLCIGFVGTPHGSRIDRINKLLEAGIPVSVHTKATAFDQKLISAPARSYLHAALDYMKYPIGRKMLLGSVVDKLGHRQFMENHPLLERKDVVPLTALGQTNRSYALVLAFSEVNSTGVLKHPVPIVNLRNFEIPMSGALQITRYSDELAGYFKEDEEIILCRDDNEFKEKAMYYLDPNRAELRQQMRAAAKARAEKEHTWYCRFKVIFERLGI